MARMAGSSAATRGGTKARDTSRRSRVWSGGSTLSMCRENSGPGRPSATTSLLSWSAASMSLEMRGSLSACRAASKPSTTRAGWPSASCTRCTGHRARACAK